MLLSPRLQAGILAGIYSYSNRACAVIQALLPAKTAAIPEEKSFPGGEDVIELIQRKFDPKDSSFAAGNYVGEHREWIAEKPGEGEIYADKRRHFAHCPAAIGV